MSNNGLGTHTHTLHAAPPFAGPQKARGEDAAVGAMRPIVVSPGNPPWCETVVVTPEMAESWLKANTRNRKCRKSRVKIYARDMAAGNWKFSTQGITFGTDGSLIDGQHRLSAVVVAGVPIAMVVWFNVPPTSRSVIDIGAPRSFSDIAELTTQQAAVATAMYRGLSEGKNASMAEKTAFYRRFNTEIDRTISRFAGVKKGITQATVLGAIARASLHMPDRDIQQFCAVLQSGIPTDDPRDITVIKLRDRLLQGIPSTGGGSVLKDIYAITASALRAFSEDRVVSKLNPVSTDPFPLPAVED